MLFYATLRDHKGDTKNNTSHCSSPYTMTFLICEPTLPSTMVAKKELTRRVVKLNHEPFFPETLNPRSPIFSINPSGNSYGNTYPEGPSTQTFGIEVPNCML